MKKYIALYFIVIMLNTAFVSCAQKPAISKSPAGYDLTKPVKYKMPDSLHEISGITFNQGNPGMFYAEEDEHGRVYFLHLGDKTAKYTSFKPTGDFEDMAICGQQVVVLQSKGALYTFPFAEVGKPQTKAQKIDNILPEGEYEGMYAEGNKVYVLCKHCSIDKTSKTNSGFIFDMAANGTVKKSGDFQISVKDIEKLSGQDKIKFHPSALAKNPVTGQWWILSSVNKMIVVADANWKVISVYPLNSTEFTQPEGITFDAQNNLYISNEGTTVPGNVLKFAYKK